MAVVRTRVCEWGKGEEGGAIEALIGQYWQEIQSSGYQRIEYKNVSDWVQKKIEEKLASGRR
jgi:hypothetical protein